VPANHSLSPRIRVAPSDEPQSSSAHEMTGFVKPEVNCIPGAFVGSLSRLLRMLCTYVSFWTISFMPCRNACMMVYVDCRRQCSNFRINVYNPSTHIGHCIAGNVHHEFGTYAPGPCFNNDNHVCWHILVHGWAVRGAYYRCCSTVRHDIASL
jgi:hypothetical protein